MVFLFGKGRPQGRPASPIGDLSRWEASDPYRIKSTIHGSSRFSWVPDWVRWGLFRGSWADAPGVPLGGGWFATEEGHKTSGVLRWCGEGHRLIVGAPGSGKFTSVIAPMLLSASDDTIIIIDPKDGEAFWNTINFRGSIGPVGVITPEMSRRDLEAAGAVGLYLSLNPLDVLTTDSPNLVRDVKRIADAIVLRSDSKRDQYWDFAAQRWLEGTILHVATWPNEDDRTLMRVQEIIADGWGDEVLFAMLNNPAGDGLIQRAAADIQQNQDDE